MTSEPSSRSLTLAYIAALTIIAVLSLTSHFLLERTLVANAGSASVINVSGRQRMLSQRIASLAAQRALGDETVRGDLLAAINEFDATHKRLIEGDAARGLPPPRSAALQALYFGSGDALDHQVRTYVADARRFAALPPGDPRVRQDLKPIFTASRRLLLTGLSAVTAEHQRQSEQHLHMLQTLQSASLAMILATLIAEAIGIFKPMVDRISLYTAELRRAATTDPLTGAYNRRSFTDRALAELSRAARSSHATSLLMIDADRFKSVNDTYGHGVGDLVLIALCSSLAITIRPSDLLGRLGGEEFAVLLPETDLPSAELAAERLRKAVETVKVPVKDEEISFTVSIGVTSLPPGDVALKAALDRADGALYRAKSGGRNRVASSAPPDLAAPLRSAPAAPEEPVLIRTR